MKKLTVIYNSLLKSHIVYEGEEGQGIRREYKSLEELFKIFPNELKGFNHERRIEFKFKGYDESQRKILVSGFDHLFEKATYTSQRH